MKLNNFQLAMWGVQGVAMSVICFVLRVALMNVSTDPETVSRVMGLLGLVSGVGGIVLILVAFFRRSKGS